MPVSHGRRLAGANGDHAQLVELEGGEHNTLRDSHPEIEAMVVGFFEENLK